MTYYTISEVENLRREIWRNVSICEMSMSLMLHSMVDIAYYLGKLAQLEDHKTNFGQCAEFKAALDQYRMQFCDAEHDVASLLSRIGDFVDARERHYRH